MYKSSADYDPFKFSESSDPVPGCVLNRRFPKPPEPEPFTLIAVTIRLLVDGPHGAAGTVIDVEPQLAEQLVRDGGAAVFCERVAPPTQKGGAAE